MRKIGIIVVHGVGEQKRFEFLESIASNLYRALRSGPNKREHPHIQLRRGDQVPHLSEEESWREAPAIVSWQDENRDGLEVHFREVHWADLDMPYSWRNWIKLVSWCLGISGIKAYEKDSSASMQAPDTVSCKDRMLLFGISLLFFLMLISVDLIYGLITRFGFRAQWLGKARGLIYNYLGDVKLYQDWFIRKDDRLETLGEKSRVAIRRRMIRALAQTAHEINHDKLDEYYVWSHSLGTVVAFNGLMEPEIALPNYFTREEWEGELCKGLKCQATEDAPKDQMPRRPSWLHERDAISREQLFAGLKGFLTMGSPLDKFAALWPAIVPANKQPIPGNKPWINVADVQDIVASSIDDFPGCTGDNGTNKVGGLRLQNFNWAGEWSLFTAHTSYWLKKKTKGDKKRLIDRLVPWLEGGDFNEPDYKVLNPCAAMLMYWASLPLLGLVLLWFSSAIAWLISKSGDLILVLGRKAAGLEQAAWVNIKGILFDGSYWCSVLCWALWILAFALIVIATFSLVRRAWEKRKFNTHKN